MWRQLKLYGLLILLAFGFGQCYQEEASFTSPIPEEKLVKVLGDIHIAESMLTEFLDRDGKDSIARVYYGIIFTMYEIDAQLFDETMALYIQHPNAMMMLYEEVEKYLKEEEKKAPKKVSDKAPLTQEQMDSIKEERGGELIPTHNPFSRPKIDTTKN